MNQKLACLLMVVLSSTSCFSQDTTTTDVTNVLRITLLGPGVSYEKKIGHLQTLYLHPHLNAWGYYIYSSNFGSDSRFDVDPALTLNYRYYYNTAKRLEKGKRTEMNSLNYVGGVYDFLVSKRPYSSEYVEETDRRAIHIVGAIWGIQRNYKGNFSLDLNLGLGYTFSKGTKIDAYTGRRISEDVSTPTTVGNFTLGLWLNRK